MIVTSKTGDIVHSAPLVITEKDQIGRNRFIAWSHQNNLVAVGCENGTVAVCDPRRRNWLWTFPNCFPMSVYSVAFNPAGTRLLCSSDEGIVLLDALNGTLLQRRLDAAENTVCSLWFLGDSERFAATSFDGQVRLWELTPDGRGLDPIASIIVFTDGSWAVIDPEGRFDGSNDGAVEGLHWVQGLEPIELVQLRKFYHEPGLLARILADQPPPFPVPDFTRSSIRLYPEVRVTPPAEGERTLTVHLTNRGGGIGRVGVWVDNTRLTEDARPRDFDPRAKEVTLVIPLDRVPALKPGEKRTYRVVGENAFGDVTMESRGVEGEYLPPQDTASAEPIKLWAIVLGISDYAERTLHLKYAAKDATDFAAVLSLAAKKLYQPEHVHLTLLTSDARDPGAAATRANIAAAFEKVRQSAKATDVLVVYGAGHGVSLHLPEQRDDLYCYLTQDAHTNVPQDLANAALRRTCAISSDDLVAWLNPATGIKANKKVIFLDTCAAGTIQQTLVAMARELTPEEVARARAISQLKENSAFHILMGCAGNRVSYEAGVYNQGLLTYALIEGIKNTGRFIEVPGIFEYVEKRVPELAAGIGGVQKPLVASPQGARIQIGEMGDQERNAIRLAARQLRLLAPVFQNPEEVGDPLGLTDRVELLLANESETQARGQGGGGFVFMGKGKLPGAVEPSGSYTIAKGKATVRIVLRRE